GAEEVPLCNRPLKVPSPLPPSPLPSPSGLISSTHQALAPLTEKQSCPDAERYIPVDKLPAKANAGNSELPFSTVTLPKTVRLAPCPSSAAPTSTLFFNCVKPPTTKPDTTPFIEEPITTLFPKEPP